MPGYFIQDQPDQPAAIYLSIDAADQIGQAVMSGFGKVPRRGAEVGGILLGTVAGGERPSIRIDDFIAVPIEYRYGPSYLLSPADEPHFAAAVAQSRSGQLRPVGFMRSTTREEKGISADDIVLLDRHFKDRPFLVLMVRPFATRPSVASFLCCADGPFTTTLPWGPEFSFRRRDLDPHTAAAAVPNAAADGAANAGPEPRKAVPALVATAPPAPDAAALPAAASDVPAAPAPAQPRGGWTWFPLSFVFLLLGILLGYEAAGAFRTNAPPPGDPWDLRLSITKSGNNLNVNWDHRSAAVRESQHGILSIVDGASHRTIDLGATELTSGSIVYAPSSTEVSFRLEVYPGDRFSLSQTAAWKQ